MAQVQQVFSQAWRASSLVECLNSVTRLQRSRRRRMTEGLLDSKRLDWNCPGPFARAASEANAVWTHRHVSADDGLGSVAQALIGVTPSTTVRARGCSVRKARDIRRDRFREASPYRPWVDLSVSRRSDKREAKGKT